MPIAPDIIAKLIEQQPQIWQTVSLTVSEATGKSIFLGDHTVIGQKTQELYSEFSAPLVAIQFAFSSMPESPMAILLSQAATELLAGSINDKEIDGIDENTVADIRSALEGMVQGVCLAVGTIRSDPIVASGLSIRHQLYSFPASMQKSDELIKVKVDLKIEGEEATAPIHWVLDAEAAHLILGMRMADESAEPFQQVQDGGGGAGAKQPHPYEDVSSLDLLMDVPLEISVELGRMKMLVKDVVELGSGSIVELNKSAGEPVDVMVNGRLVARGEVIVIEDNFGVRITEILNPHERMARLNDAA